MYYDYYFCCKLTEDEHDIVEYEIKQRCEEYECELLYYRKLKEGHFPMYREVKIASHNKSNIHRMLKFINGLWVIQMRNPYKCSFVI